MTTVLVIIVILILVVAGIAVVRMLSSGSNNETTAEDGVVTTVSLEDELLKTDESRSVRVKARGPLVANEDFVSQEVVVSPAKRKAVVYSGYLDKVERSVTLDNSVKAYSEFVNALNKASFTSVKNSEYNSEEEILGVCAGGRVYQYEILDGDEVVHWAWASTCNNPSGTLKTGHGAINKLFELQIPDDKFEFANY